MIYKPVILGDGQLGTEIRNQTGWDYISRKKDGLDAEYGWIEFDKYIGEQTEYEMIINCIGFTDTYSEDRDKHWNINYKFVAQLADYCQQYSLMLVQISTDYIYSNSKPNASEDDVPVHCANWYGYTKILADGYVQLKVHEYLIVRCSFKPSPFPYDNALVNQVGNFDYTDVIASKIVNLCKNTATGVYNVGTDAKTIYTLAKKTRPDVKPNNEKIHKTMPIDITMNCSKMRNELYGQD